MNARFLILGLLIVFVLFGGLVRPMRALSLGLLPIATGFGPDSLAPISQGTPVYTYGDEVWVESYSNVSVTAILLPPSGEKSMTQQTLSPYQPTPMYKFAPHDPIGFWQLYLTTVNQTIGSTSFELTAINRSASATLAGVSLSGGRLSTTLTIDASDAYAVQTCMTGAIVPSTFGVSFPAGVGNGQLFLSGKGKNFTILLDGSVQKPVAFWFELHHPYSFKKSSENGTGLISRDLKVASTQPVIIDPKEKNKAYPVSINQLPARDGRYSLRGFFRSDQGLSVQEYPLLLQTTGSWVPLAGCILLSSPEALSFTLDSRLDMPTSDWPRGVYVMFRANGLEAYSFAQINAGLSAVRLVGSPWNMTARDIQASAAGDGIRGSESVNGTVYLIADSYPLKIDLTVTFGNLSYETLKANVSTSYSESEVSVPLGRVSVHTTLNGRPYANALVGISNGQNGSVTRLTDQEGSTISYLPTGRYNLTVSGAKAASSYRISVEAGKELALNVELGPQPVDIIQYLLLGAGVAGLLANVLVWMKFWQLRKPES